MFIKQLQETVKDAFAKKIELDIQSGNSKRFLGRTPKGAALSIAQYSGIVEYDPAELVITVKAGTALRDINSALAKNNQYLPFDAPNFSTESTIGGVVAAGLSGPIRPWTGSVRDYVLGIECIDGRGDHLRFGGRVMKNVAGYDVSRLIVGSMGTLGIILQMSFKVLPKPETSATVYFDCSQVKSIEKITQMGLTSLPLSASLWVANKLFVRLSGSQAAVAKGLEIIGGNRCLDNDLWQKLRDHTHSFFHGGSPLWRVSVPANSAVAEIGDECLVEWGGSLRWYKSSQQNEQFHEYAQKCGGNAILFRNGDRSSDVNGKLHPVLGRIHKQLKKSFDPGNILNPGRMYKDL
jgi:glycolate oxidase FAD binding subunit